MTQGLEPNLAYSEIIGVIKGSQAALESPEGYLSRGEYLDSLSHRQFPLLANVRAKVYSIFEVYTKQKTARHETDPADRYITVGLLRNIFSNSLGIRTRLILRNLSKILPEPNIDFLFVWVLFHH